MKVFVIGSCVTRDAFNFSENHELVDYVARTSFASQSREPWIDNKVLDNIASSFQRRMVEYDMQKSLSNRLILNSEECDFFILDLIDDRFDLVEYTDGCYATRSVEFMKGIGKGAVKRRISHFEDEYFDFWKKGFEDLVLLLGKNIKKLKVNSVYWAFEDGDGDAISGFDYEHIKSENDLLNKKYKYMSNIIPDSCFVRFEDDVFVSSKSHKWGCSPFHYDDKYYHELIKKIDLF